MMNLITVFFCLANLQTNIDTVPVSGRVIAADLDVKGNVYVVDSSYRLCKITPQNTVVCNSVAQYGEGVLLDADNPIEPMLFFQNSGMLLVTDNNLNTTATISLFSQNNMKPGGFGRANDGMVWVFDDNSSTLKKLNRSGAVVQESLVLCAKGNKNRKVQAIQDNGKLIVLRTPQNNTLVLNMNLNILAELPEKEGVCVDVAGDRLLLLKEGEIWLTEPFGNKGKRMPVARQKSGASISGLLLALRGNYQLTETPSGLILRNR